MVFRNLRKITSATVMASVLVWVAYSVPAVAGQVATGPTTVIEVTEYGTHKALHIGVKDPINPASCEYGARLFRVVPSEGYEQVVSIALAALLSGKTVYVAVEDDRCYGGWPQVHNITIREN